MPMTPRLRALSLTTHIGSSVGWFGAVASFLALTLVGVMREDPEVVRSTYVAMHLTTWLVIVPFAGASLLSGIVQSLGTPWGLFRHYWVAIKQLLTAIATLLLLLHTRPINQVAALAATRALVGQELWSLRMQLVGDASAALFVLGVTTALSVFKPFGMTPYGIREQSEHRYVPLSRANRPTLSGKHVIIAIGALLAVIGLLHIFGVGMHGH